MKTTLTSEESQRLIELGVDPKMASYSDVVADESGNHYVEKLIFHLTDILSILPKEIVLESGLHCDLKMQCVYTKWTVGYTPYAMSIFRASELIDALYSLLIWCLEEKIIKL